jgi:hypothetical protein
VPPLYAFVQAEYWGVGFLRYYQWKQVGSHASLQCAVAVCRHVPTSHVPTSRGRSSCLQLPNFLLAAPALAVAASSARTLLTGVCAQRSRRGVAAPVGVSLLPRCRGVVRWSLPARLAVRCAVGVL